MIRCGLIGLVCAALYLIIDAGVASAQVTILHDGTDDKTGRRSRGGLRRSAQARPAMQASLSIVQRTRRRRGQSAASKCTAGHFGRDSGAQWPARAPRDSACGGSGPGVGAGAGPARRPTSGAVRTGHGAVLSGR